VSIALMKSILAIVLTLMALLQLYLMLEVFGRTEALHNAGRLRKIHRINGRLFIILYFFIAYFCLQYIITGKEELSPRVTLHVTFALYVILLLALKISALRIYHKAYQNIVVANPLVLGPVIVLLTLGMAALAGGYYFFVTLF
jgi:hypothetical protein